MPYPPLVKLRNEQEYLSRFLSKYCSRHSITTHDGLSVKFYKRHFRHAFYEAANRQQGDKSQFSLERAKRIDWIETSLADSTAELYVGYDKHKRRHDPSRCVSISNGNYVVVIEIIKGGGAVFVTAFSAGRQTLTKIRTNPKWPKK
jgi:hypothetical protein